MENKNRNEEFKFTYSAKTLAEVKSIRDKYVPQEESNLERLRRLDNGVTQKAQIVSLVLGIIGALILGFGMSLCLSELSAIFGVHKTLSTVFGIIIGIMGGILISLAYPVYNFVLKRGREKIAPEIIRLSDELIK